MQPYLLHKQNPNELARQSFDTLKDISNTRVWFLSPNFHGTNKVSTKVDENGCKKCLAPYTQREINNISNKGSNEGKATGYSSLHLMTKRYSTNPAGGDMACQKTYRTQNLATARSRTISTMVTKNTTNSSHGDSSEGPSAFHKGGTNSGIKQKPFNLSRSNSRRKNVENVENKKPFFKALAVPDFSVPFVVYKATGGLTKFQEFQFATSQSKEERKPLLQKHLAKPTRGIVSCNLSYNKKCSPGLFSELAKGRVRAKGCL